jgi:phosphotriesterase-related protein
VIRTVLGDIEDGDAGIVLPHEHLLCDSSVWLQEPSDDMARRLVDAAVTLENLWWMRQFPNTSREVVVLDDLDVAVAELAQFAALGGSTVVDLTPRELGRDIHSLVAVSRRTGVHVVAATGHYIAPAHPPAVATSPPEEIAEAFVREILHGIDGTGHRAGVIGEIGLSHPVHPHEAKVLQAAALAQKRTGAAISVHTAAHAIDADSALDALAVLERHGGDVSRVVLGHMDTTLHRPEYHREVLARGAVVEFDLFGHEFFESENDFQSFGDTETARAVALLVEAGYAEQLLLSHDICYKIQLTRYGGYGYGHLLRNVRRRLALWGCDDEAFDQMTRRNPQRILALAGPPEDVP